MFQLKAFIRKLGKQYIFKDADISIFITTKTWILSSVKISKLFLWMTVRYIPVMTAIRTFH